MQATAPVQQEEDTRGDRRDRYHKLLGIVEHNTGGMQRSTVSLGAVLTVASYCDIQSHKAKSSLQAAVSNDDLLEFDGRFARTDTESLREVLIEESERKSARRALVKRCNRLLEAGDR
ncbi:hypothetical protein [Haloprofundus salilacus]|uniref:hypothetical protein n=1 Tax=Haloprofundus salilacus TaxID=2876190 RepID=UPI001CCACDFE|nr:hypothetical protein [Haloprofundus salilacus]